MKNVAKYLLLLFALLLPFSVGACAAEPQYETPDISTLEEDPTVAQSAFESAGGLDEHAQNASPYIAKEDGAVLIYNGEIAAEGGPEALAAVAESLELEVIYFDSADMLPTLLNSANLCVIGGTEDDLSPLIQEFTPEIRTALDDWIKSGGGFLGVCGGAYIGSQGWEEDGGFVDMLGLAPVVTEEYLSDPDSRIITVNWNDEHRTIYYAYGPAFLVTNTPDTETIATFMDGRVAAFAYQYGDGLVILSGPHPEADETWLDDDPAPIDAEQWEDTADLILELFHRFY